MRSEPRIRLRGLYAITPESLDTPALISSVEQCLEGGAALVQYRAKTASPTLAMEQARRLVALCRSFGVPLIVNDSIDLARASGADGIHLGRDDASIEAARQALPGAIIGVSCYADPSLARSAAQKGADYVAMGSVFASSTKPRAVRAALASLGEAGMLPAGTLPQALRAVPAALLLTPEGTPILLADVTAGVIGAAHAGWKGAKTGVIEAVVALAAGADMLAVITSLFAAPDVRAAARAFSDRFDMSSRETRGQSQSRAL